MGLIEVNQERCTRCGICTDVCPTRVLAMSENGPEAIAPEVCIACGHCVAVCPHQALDNKKAPLNKQIALAEFPALPAQKAQLFLRSRRSIRKYKERSVPREQLLQLIEIARFAPTASNGQGVSYIIIENKELIEKLIEVVIEWMESQISVHWSFLLHVKAYREDKKDTIFRGAPHIILATANKDFSRGRENTVFALTYLELYATTLGLGSCWAGLFEICAFSGYKPLLELLNIPEGKEITGTVMVGYPQYKYQRLVDRNPLDVTWL
ncbi:MULTISPECIES: nitroreductase family protein [Pelosinus]|uniref:Nitroreductase n=1 Tax=Pelosinus fermentans B4 TaxID=1149862 RepID=I8RBF8_9FIRM|nr:MULTISPECIES: nitroreductase family protein [Pelosinus]EIW16328.1 nitroreductase [Pelosinus fermentans B4]EIW22692.1 nitroreductase [Pelosinus fermentans A11]OAM95635.1 nitroreductase [Pelosinus fermentans DSM 17108]SDR30861.1 Nitroreductase [Pelosinus fermentans]